MFVKVIKAINPYVRPYTFYSEIISIQLPSRLSYYALFIFSSCILHIL